MFDIASLGNVASIAGLVVAICVALYQRDAALKAKNTANAEKARAATLEDHLARQRWQQLRSLGEQIDTLEQEKRHTTDATGAALHARLKEQYSSLLGVIATSTLVFSAAVLRHWVYTGRLLRPWQIEEALCHLEFQMSNGEITEDEEWLRTIIDKAKTAPGSYLRTLHFPLEINEYVALYILVAAAVEEQVRESVKKGGQITYSLAVLLHHLTEDCLEKNKNKIGTIRLKSWGWDTGKTFAECLLHYQELDFWVVVDASETAQKKLRGYDEFFVSYDYISKMIIPTQKAVELSRKKYPLLPEIVEEFFKPKEIK